MIEERFLTMNKLILTRKDNEVFFENRKLTIVTQASKGLNKEVVKILGLPNSNDKKWVSLSLLKQGLNELECKATIRTNSTSTSKPAQDYVLTQEEHDLLRSYQDKIEAIIVTARARFVPKPVLDVNVHEMTEAQRLAKIEELKKYYNL